jgi:transposase
VGVDASNELEAVKLRAQLAAMAAQLEAERSHFEAAQGHFERESARTRDVIALLERERDALRASHERLRLELELLKRRLFIAKAERVDTQQLELEFAGKMRELETLAGTLGIREHAETSEPDENDAPKKPKSKPTGRRDVRTLALEEVRIELPDPAMEELVAAGKAYRHSIEESVTLRRQRGGMRRVVVARPKYRSHDEVNDETGAMTIYTAPMPPMMFPRSIAMPSLIAHIASRKITEGMPLFRIEEGFEREGVPIDRGMMSRWLEHLGATLGATVIEAMRKDAMARAFCIATDATGIAIQPTRSHERERKPSKRGHFLVQVADRDHIFFEYLERETSAAIGALFRGYSGYVQADAKSVFDALFEPPQDDGDERIEVGCWSHARRKFWEASAAKSAVAREGLMRIGRIFELDASWRKRSPSQIKSMRDAHLRAHVQAFFHWARTEYDLVRSERGLLSTALGYATRQEHALIRFLDDGKLVLDNNRSERELRRVAVGRKAWLFCGSDDHAQSAANLFTIVASAKLHGIDPEAYLASLMTLIPQWPADRFLELAPLYWGRTRERIDSKLLEDEIGWLKVPEPLELPR